MAQDKRTFSALVGAGGMAVVTMQTNQLATWVISQVSVELTTAPAGATCALRHNGYLVTVLIPTGDAATGDPPVTLLPGDNATVTWTGCTPGTVGKVLIYFDDGK